MFVLIPIELSNGNVMDYRRKNKKVQEIPFNSTNKFQVKYQGGLLDPKIIFRALSNCSYFLLIVIAIKDLFSIAFIYCSFNIEIVKVVALNLFALFYESMYKTDKKNGSKEFKSDNFSYRKKGKAINSNVYNMGRNREKSNIAIAILEKFTI